ncbi:MAG TPA: hypothetical protein VGD98_14815 [Ktedonobacteraceae bacterium]
MTIRDSHKFYGRHDDLDYLYNEISAHRCVSVIGNRRIGKSSLLYCLSLLEKQQEFAEIYNLTKHILVFLDMGEYLSCIVAEFFTKICEQMLSQVTDRITPDQLAELNKLGKYSGEECFWRLLEKLQDQGFYPVLLLDGFQKITRNQDFGPKFFAFMRAQANMGRVSYITSSIATLDQCCHAYVEGSPFFNIFLPYRLRSFTEEEACQLITQPALSVDLPFTDEEAKHILRLAGCHPFFLQRTCFLFFRAKTQNRQDNLRQLSAEIYDDLLPHFIDIWEHSLEASEREALKEEVRWENVGQRRLPELSESALLRQFVRDTCSIQLIDITPEILESILENYRDTQQLAESELTHLYLFTSYTQHIHHQLTINEKAIYVRKILQNARDRLVPTSSLHSDTNTDWQLFNILNYRYLKEHMKNEILADRIGISVRQLQRERKTAIQLLHNALLDMDKKARDNDYGL